MQIKTKAIDAVNASLSAKIPSADVKAKLENAAKKAAKNMKIDGFRAGKVPVNVVLKRYEKELTADAEQDALGIFALSEAFTASIALVLICIKFL